jgi:hypothetical protein
MAGLLLTVACGAEEPEAPTETGNGGAGGETPGGAAGAPIIAGALGALDETDLPEPERRTGFVEVPPYSYSWQYSSEARETSATRLFYDFIPARTNAKDRPVFLLMNGGPGSTSMFLHSFGTGPFALTESDFSAPLVENDSSWNDLGSLLYVDARLTGFSYSLSDDPRDPDERLRAFDGQSLNTAVEAADTIRVLLSVLAEQPALQNNPVVLVGESAAGYRAPLMLELLLDPPRADGEARWFDDPSLTEELQRHFAFVFPEVPFSALSPERRARQFGWQVLIQPAAMAPWQQKQPNPVLAHLSGCVHHTERSEEWCAAQSSALVRTMLSPAQFETMFGISPTNVPGLPAAERVGAIGCPTAATCGLAGDDIVLAPPSSWLEAMGEIADHDRYFTTLRSYQYDDSVASDPDRVPFLRVLPYTQVLITNAQLDAAIFSPAIVGAIRAYGAAQPTPWVEAADYVGPDPDEVSEAFEVRFADDAVRGAGSTRRVYLPRYTDSGHMVALTEPAKLHDDVHQFLVDTGALQSADP